jgi:hypothetical protein
MSKITNIVKGFLGYGEEHKLGDDLKMLNEAVDESKQVISLVDESKKIILLSEIAAFVVKQQSEVPCLTPSLLKSFHEDNQMDYVSHATNTRISVKMLRFMFDFPVFSSVYRDIIANRTLCFADVYSVPYYCNFPKEGGERIPAHQIHELLRYFAADTEEKRNAIQTAFLTRDQFLVGLTSMQHTVACKNMLHGIPLPQVLQKQEIKTFKNLKDMVGKHLWGSQFKEIMKTQLKMQPIKLLNVDGIHNGVLMEIDKEIIDPVQFQPKAQCSAGVYGTAGKSIPHWLDYSLTLAYVADMEAPDHAQVYMECENKFKMNCFILRNKRLISELQEWNDLDFVYTACTKSSTASGYNSNTPLCFKLHNAHRNPNNFIGSSKTHLLNWNNEPLASLYVAVSHSSAIILELTNPPKALILHALNSSPLLVSRLKPSLLDQEIVEFACHRSSFECLDSVPFEFISFPMIYFYVRHHIDYMNSCNSNAVKNVAKAFFAIEDREKEEKEEKKNDDANGYYYRTLWQLNPPIWLHINRHDTNLKRKRARYFLAVDFLASNQMHLNHFTEEKELQEEAYQLALISSPVCKEKIIQAIKTPTPQVLALFNKTFPFGFRFLPQPWDPKLVVKCATEHDSSILNSFQLSFNSHKLQFLN